MTLNCLNCFVYRLTVESDSLTIDDVTEDDAGVYTCIINTTLDHDSASAELTVVGMYLFAEAQFHELIKQTCKLLKCVVSMSGLPRKVNLSNNVQVMSFQHFEVNCVRVYLTEWI